MTDALPPRPVSDKSPRPRLFPRNLGPSKVRLRHAPRVVHRVSHPRLPRRVLLVPVRHLADETAAARWADAAGARVVSIQRQSKRAAPESRQFLAKIIPEPLERAGDVLRGRLQQRRAHLDRRGDALVPEECSEEGGSERGRALRAFPRRVAHEQQRRRMRHDPREVEASDPHAGPERDELRGERVPVHAHERRLRASVEHRRGVRARQEGLQRSDQHGDRLRVAVNLSEHALLPLGAQDEQALRGNLGGAGGGPHLTDLRDGTRWDGTGSGRSVRFGFGRRGF
mmetsp:Transcript_1746/g.7229  ORF Transcript_1746/g.7229 Transcript_1746/m.7229 type:complete len:284 (-) Transcript_1746:629-1480(-)